MCYARTSIWKATEAQIRSHKARIVQILSLLDAAKESNQQHLIRFYQDQLDDEQNRFTT